MNSEYQTPPPPPPIQTLNYGETTIFCADGSNEIFGYEIQETEKKKKHIYVSIYVKQVKNERV